MKYLIRFLVVFDLLLVIATIGSYRDNQTNFLLPLDSTVLEITLVFIAITLLLYFVSLIRQGKIANNIDKRKLVPALIATSVGLLFLVEAVLNRDISVSLLVIAIVGVATYIAFRRRK